MADLKEVATRPRRTRRAKEALAVHGLAQVAKGDRMRGLMADLRQEATKPPTRRAKEAIAAHGLAQLGKDASVRAGVAELGEAMKPALQRVTESLDRRQAEAQTAWEAAQASVPEPAEIEAMEERLAQARADKKQAFDGTRDAEKAAEETRDRPKPRTFFAWITGRTARWQREHDAAVTELASIAARRTATESEVKRLEGELKDLKLHFRPEIEAEERRRARDGEKAGRTLDLLRAAKEILAETPGLAQEGEEAVLRAAAERLRQEELDAIRREQERLRWQRESFQAPLPEDAPGDPKFR